MRLETFPAKYASGVLLADALEAAVAARAVTPSLLAYIGRVSNEMPFVAWQSERAGGGGTLGGAVLSRMLASLVTLQTGVLRQVPRHRRALALSQDAQAAGVLAGVALVRGAVMRVVAQLPPTALSSRAIGLLAYGCTRSWGVDRSAQEKKAMKLAVRRLAHAAASRAFAPQGPGGLTGSGGDATVLATARDSALLAGALMKAGLSGHAVWPLIAQVVINASSAGSTLQLQDAAYLGEALAWERRVAKGPQGGGFGGGGVTNLAPEDERLLVGVLRQSLVRHLGGGGGVTP